MNYDIKKQLISFGDLPDGWHYGTGGSIPRERIASALEWNEWLVQHGWTDTFAFPGESKEIMLSSLKDSTCLDIILEIDDTFTVIYEEKDKEDIYIDKLTEEDAKATCISLVNIRN